MKEVNGWKVYQMDDCMLIAAKSKEDALDFYRDQELISMEESEEHFEGEVDLYKTSVLVNSDRLSDADKGIVRKVMGDQAEDILRNESFKCQLAIWLEIELLAGRNKPFFIACREY